MFLEGRPLSRCPAIRPMIRPLASCLGKIWLISCLVIVLIYCLDLKYRISHRISEGVEEGSRMSLSDLLTGQTLEGFSVPLCPATPPNLKGRQEVKENVTLEEAEANVTLVKEGGFWSPTHCQPRWRVAIIVPYRDRQSQIGAFMLHMHNFLQRQELNYSIYIVEQEGEDFFNRARLLNVGYLEAQKEGPWDCIAFHDVDMLPEDDRHLYHCSMQPRHLAVATSDHGYKLVYSQYFGGACLMTKEQVETVNGWSNIYWGWGAEDDDMWRRVAFADLQVWRYPLQVARYKSSKHKRQPANNERGKILRRNTGRYPYDGLNSIEYKLRNITRRSLYTHLFVDVGSSKAPTAFAKGVHTVKKKL